MSSRNASTKLSVKEKELVSTSNNELIPGTAEDSLVGMESGEHSRNHSYWASLDFSPDEPMRGEKPNDLLQRLYEMWPDQLTSSYRPHVPLNPEATADTNLRNLRELYPTKVQRSHLLKARSAGFAVEAACRLGGSLVPATSRLIKFHFKETHQGSSDIYRHGSRNASHSSNASFLD